jgi:hypothetical protein
MAGRPVAHEITEHDLEEMARMAGLGLPDKSIAYVLNIPQRTFARYKANDERIVAYLEKGRAEAEDLVAKVLLDEVKKHNMTALIWYEKTRLGRYERSRQEVTGANGGPIEERVAADSPRAWIEGELARLAERQRTGGDSPSGNGRRT